MANAFLEGSSNGWNYAHPEAEGYTLTLQGQIVEMDTPWARDFETKEPKVFKDGNPVRTIKVTVLDLTGEEKTWYAGGKKSIAATALLDAIRQATGNQYERDLTKCIGRMVSISTEQAPKGFGYTKQNPRPWSVALGEMGPAENVHDPAVKDSCAEEWQATRAQQPAQPAPVQQPPVAGVPVPNPYVTPQQYVQQAAPNVPAAMQAQIANAMANSVGYRQAVPQPQPQPVPTPVPAPQPEMYDQDIPF